MTSPDASGSGATPAGLDTASRNVRWLLVALWVTLPIGLGGALDGLLAGHSGNAASAAAVVLWAGWAAGVVAVLVPRTSSLTAIRILAPAAAAAPLVAAATRAAEAPAVDGLVVAVGITAGIAAAGVSLTSWIGHAFVNGSSYGAELRFLLRPPTALLLGPIELAWLALVGLPTLGGLLVARGVAAVGIVLLLLSVPVGVVVVRSLHGQVRRWVVLVPAGLVVHDAAALVDNVLFPRQLRPHLSVALDPPAAEDGSTPIDLTLGASGLVVQVDLSDAAPVTPRPRQRPGAGTVAETIDTTAVLVVPTRPGLLLRTAHGG